MKPLYRVVKTLRTLQTFVISNDLVQKIYVVLSFLLGEVYVLKAK